MLSTCAEYCGNAIKTMSEDCDMGLVTTGGADTYNADVNHCKLDCMFNSDWWNVTVGTTTTWTKNTCGDGHLIGNEVCDSGSTVSYDSTKDGC